MSLTCFADREYSKLLLSGLPHSAIVLYLWLRSRMTWETRRVGDHKAAISWQAITEALEIEWRPGWLTSMSQSAARRAAQRLVRAGLVVMHSNSTERRLIFECVLAPQNSSVQKMADRSKRGHPDRPFTRETPPHPDRSKTGHPDRHLDFVVPEVHTDARAKDSPVDNCGAGALVFPSQLTAKQNRALGALLKKSNANGGAQPMLDEIAARLERQTASIGNPAEYLKALIEADARGEFWPCNRAVRIASERRERAATQCNIAAAHNERPATRQTINAALVTLKKLTVH